MGSWTEASLQRRDSLGTNIRLRWEYQPGSELFVVCNDARSTAGPRVAALEVVALMARISVHWPDGAGFVAKEQR